MATSFANSRQQTFYIPRIHRSHDAGIILKYFRTYIKETMMRLHCIDVDVDARIDIRKRSTGDGNLFNMAFIKMESSVCKLINKYIDTQNEKYLRIDINDSEYWMLMKYTGSFPVTQKCGKTMLEKHITSLENKIVNLEFDMCVEGQWKNVAENYRRENAEYDCMIIDLEYQATKQNNIILTQEQEILRLKQELKELKTNKDPESQTEPDNDRDSEYTLIDEYINDEDIEEGEIKDERELDNKNIKLNAKGFPTQGSLRLS